MQKETVRYRCVLVVTEDFNIAGSDYDAKKSARYSRVLIVTRDVIFTIETGHSHRQPMLPDILQRSWWQEDSTTDLYLSHVYLLFIFIYDMLICIKNKLFDSFHNDISYIQLHFNWTKNTDIE